MVTAACVTSSTPTAATVSSQSETIPRRDGVPIEENGSFSVNGDSVTITPRTSKATLRNRDGVVQETRANPLEKVTYKWTTHFFEAIGETNLVLQPPSATSRDGVLDSMFPNAYLYTQADKLEWRL